MVQSCKVPEDLSELPDMMKERSSGSNIKCVVEIKVEEMSHAIRLLRSFEGVDVIVTGELKANFAQDTDARWLMKVEEHVRRVQLH